MDSSEKIVTAKRPNYVLTGDNIVEHIYAQQEMGHQTKNYFHFSPLWRAIRRYIEQNVQDCALLDPPYNLTEEPEYLSIRCYRGTGRAVHFRDVAIYGIRGESLHIELTVEIEWEIDLNNTVVKKHRFQVPVALCKRADDYPEDFKEDFDLWISGLARAKQEKNCEQDAETLRALIKKYPSLGATECQRALDKILTSADATDPALE